MQHSFTRLKNETSEYFETIQTLSDWTQERLNSLSSLGSMIQLSLFKSEHVLQFLLHVFIALVITSIPGVRVDAFNKG